MMFTLAHLSDIHLSPLPRPRYAELMSKRMFGYLNWQRRRRHYSRGFLDRLTHDLLEQRPDHIAITGDLVNLSLPVEFHLAHSWLRSLGTPDRVSVIPGNHDAYVRLRHDAGFRRWDEYMRSNGTPPPAAPSQASGGFPYVRRHGGVALIGLSSAVPTLPLMASGRLGAAQLTRLGIALDTLREERLCRVILIHHPPLPGMAPWRSALHDAPAMRDCLLRHGAELVLHGHMHTDSLTRLTTPHGLAPVVGIASASSGAKYDGRRARYNLFTLRKTSAGWSIHMRGRSFSEDGRLIELDHGLLRNDV